MIELHAKENENENENNKYQKNINE